MRVSRLLPALLLLASARAGDPEKVEMPFAPFASSQKGDFETLLLRFWDLDATDRPAQKTALTYRITEADEKTVKLEFSILPESPGKRFPSITFARDDRPPPPFPDSAPIASAVSVAVTDTTRTIGGKTFACKLLSYKTRRVLPAEKGDDVVEERDTRFYCSSEVKAGGIVAFATETHVTGGAQADLDSHSEGELVGFGNGDDSAWGKKAEAVGLAPELPPAPISRPLPQNPYANARAGDWQVLLQTTTPGDTKLPKQRVVLVFKIAKVEGDVVSMEQEIRTSQGTRNFSGTVSRTEAVTLEDYAHFNPREVSDVVFLDETKAVGDKKLACTKVSFQLRRVSPLAEGRRGVFKSVSQIWTSPDMPGRGLVAQSVETTATGTTHPIKVRLDIEVLGFGNGDTATWGKKPADVKLEDFGK